MGKTVAQFDPMTKDVTVRDIKPEPLLNPDAHVIPQEDNPIIMYNEDDNDISIRGGRYAQNVNPVAAIISKPRCTCGCRDIYSNYSRECKTKYNSC